eukprot:Hpha_TRINITY_DN30924_c0_g1::TRINITY_DN30924_c0_g1_i1::g.112290::m.112290
MVLQLLRTVLIMGGEVEAESVVDFLPAGQVPRGQHLLGALGVDPTGVGTDSVHERRDIERILVRGVAVRGVFVEPLTQLRVVVEVVSHRKHVLQLTLPPLVRCRLRRIELHQLHLQRVQHRVGHRKFLLPVRHCQRVEPIAPPELSPVLPGPLRPPCRAVVFQKSLLVSLRVPQKLTKIAAQQRGHQHWIDLVVRGHAVRKQRLHFLPLDQTRARLSPVGGSRQRLERLALRANRRCGKGITAALLRICLLGRGGRLHALAEGPGLERKRAAAADEPRKPLGTLRSQYAICEPATITQYPTHPRSTKQ